MTNYMGEGKMTGIFIHPLHQFFFLNKIVLWRFFIQLRFLGLKRVMSPKSFREKLQ